MAKPHKVHLPARTDLTSDFHTLVSNRGGQYPPQNKAPQRKDPLVNVVRAQQHWLSQAYVIRKHIVSLLTFLLSIRRRYLALGTKARHHYLKDTSPENKTPDSGSDATSSAFAKWNAFTGPLTDVQRDEIDYQVKVVVKRCLDSIRELERSEEARKENGTNDAFSAISAQQPIGTLNSARFVYLYLGILHDSAHRSSVIQYLSTLLSKASLMQGGMQEARLQVQRDKTRSLANSRPQQQPSSASASSAASAVIKGSVGGSFNPGLDSESGLVGKDISTQLSAAQIQMFENESSELIKSLEADLASIKKAESRLYEISDLQTQVVQQLEQQGEITNQLFDEAIGVGTEVGRGNEELTKARKRSRDADKFMSIFLFGSGLALLFLHWMD